MDAEARRKLEELRDTIARATPVDAEGAALLKSLDEDIHRLMAHEAASGDHGGMLDGLRRAVEHFEATHPDLTASLSRAVDLLAGGGL